MNTVEVFHLAKRFGAKEAVADVSFAVAPGEIFGLLGPNGAGKTLFLGDDLSDAIGAGGIQRL